MVSAQVRILFYEILDLVPTFDVLHLASVVEFTFAEKLPPTEIESYCPFWVDPVTFVGQFTIAKAHANPCRVDPKDCIFHLNYL